MKRLQIMIDEDLDCILERMARDEGTSKAALIRRFVRQRVRPLPAMHNDPIWGLAGIADVEVEPGESVDNVVYP